MTAIPTLAQNIEVVNQRIVAAATRANRDPNEITLVAVSKTKPAAQLVEVIQAGITHLGENRLEETAHKIPDVEHQTPDKAISWHMIGHIQSRKAKLVVEQGFDVIHSIDSVKIATRLNKHLAEQGRQVRAFIEVNVSGEDAKHGFMADVWANDVSQRTALYNQITTILELPFLKIDGLMTMAPYYAEPEATRPVFKRLAALREALQNDFPQLTLPHLSMGMTNDFEIAIEEGATIIRVGRAIFGERVP